MSEDRAAVRYAESWPVVGHSWAIEHLTRSLNHDRVRHAYLITGPAGIGKTTLARALAQAVNCLGEETRPCGVCRACTLIARDVYADVSIVQAEGGTLKIEQVREMQRTLSLRPVEGRYRVVILRRFDEASPQAMDALLKTLEEPPSYVLLLLTATTGDSLLPTIRSRCQPIHLRPLSAALVRQALEAHWQVEPERAALLAQLSGGRIGWAARAAEDKSILAERAEFLDMLEKAIGHSRVGRFALAETLSKEKEALASVLELWQSYWRDVLLLIHSTVTPITNRDRRHALEQLAVSVSVEEVQQAMAAIQRTTRYLAQNANVRLALDVLMLDLPRLQLVAAPPG
jgi:DNA polymerase III subunit delta'